MLCIPTSRYAIYRLIVPGKEVFVIFFSTPAGRIDRAPAPGYSHFFLRKKVIRPITTTNIKTSANW